MRTHPTVALMFLLVGMAAPPLISQENPGPGPRDSHPTITSIEVAENADSVDVEVEFSKLVQPDVRRLEHPDRLMFDFPGCELTGPGPRFAVNHGAVLAVSTAAFGAASRGTSVVIELGPGHNRERASAGNKLVVNLTAIGNKLIIELRENGGAPPSALTSEGNKPATHSSPASAPDRKPDDVESKSEAAPPVPSPPPAVLGVNRTAPKTTEVVLPIPSTPALVLRSDRQSPKLAEAVPPMISVPPALGRER